MTTSAGPMSLARQRNLSERIIELLLFAAAALSVLTTVGIIAVLAFQTFEFFTQVSPIEFFTGTVWSASIKPQSWGVLPLVSGTLLVAGIAMIVAVPLGLLAAVLLAEYASTRIRTFVKPILETIAGIPTIVLGFFALNFLAPQVLQPLLGKENIGLFSALSGGIVVGLLITPLIASISEDAMRAVPSGMREGAYAMGATRFETIRKVVFPAALSGIMASLILAMSRAIGETMAVVLAVGTQPQLTFDPTESVQTMTAFIVQISIGETAQGSLEFKSLFAVGATLFVMTLALNLISSWVVRRYRTAY
ncbi:MAG: phosphate ABC transporter permease subunit PstC [Chloroflexota bacterium]|jgi:phosphate transport system permease protein|nr:phosphate ABC transporter permease subunit PstC [Chloroflexota bacterium]